MVSSRTPALQLMYGIGICHHKYNNDRGVYTKARDSKEFIQEITSAYTRICEEKMFRN